MNPELAILHDMLGQAGVEKFNLTVALAKAQAEVEKLKADLIAAQDKLLHFEAERPASTRKK
jgi:hypothetical protein